MQLDIGQYLFPYMSTHCTHFKYFFHKIFNYFWPRTEELLSCCGRDKECEQLVGGREVNTEHRREDGGHISGHSQPLARTLGGTREYHLCRIYCPEKNSWHTLPTTDPYF